MSLRITAIFILISSHIIENILFLSLLVTPTRGWVRKYNESVSNVMKVFRRAILYHHFFVWASGIFILVMNFFVVTHFYLYWGEMMQAVLDRYYYFIVSWYITCNIFGLVGVVMMCQYNNIWRTRWDKM